MPNPYGRHWRTVERPETLQRDCWECCRCGMPDRPTGLRSALDVAHLDGDPSHSEPDNRATLCRQCHRKHDMPSWSEKFKEYLRSERERRITGKDAARPILALAVGIWAWPPEGDK